MKKVRSKLHPTEIGVIKTFSLSPKDEIGEIAVECSGCTYYYNNLSELCEKWEDYEEPKEYWYIDQSGKVRSMKLDMIEQAGNLKVLKRYKEIGNYFDTREEAEKAVEKLKALTRLKNKGFRFAGWDMRNGDGGYEPSIGFELNGVTDVLEEDEISQEIAQDLEICFGGEE